MNRTFLLAAIPLLLLPLAADASWIGNVELAYAPGSNLPHGQHASVTFDYQADDAGGVRFWVQPLNGTTPVAGYSWSGSAVYGPGSGTHTTWWTFPSDAEATHYRIRMTTADWSTDLLVLDVPCWYEFTANAIWNVGFSDSSPSWFIHDHELTVDFDVQSEDADGCYVFARPFTDGALTPGYGAQSSFITGGSGHGAHWFRFAGDADVDQVRIQMYDHTNTTLLRTIFVPVDYHWGLRGVSNIALDTPSPSLLPYGHHVTASFDYATVDTGSQYVLMWPQLGGGYAPGGWYQASAPLPSIGSTTRYVYIDATGDAIDGLLFGIGPGSPIPTAGEIPVDYTYATHALWNPVYDIESPAVLDYLDHVSATVQYSHVEVSGARIASWPIGEGFGIGDWYYNGSPLYATGEGTADVWFTIASGPAHVTGMRVFMVAEDDNELLADWTFPCDYWFGQPGFYTGADETPGAPRLVGNHPNPFNPSTTISFEMPAAGRADVTVYSVDGRKVRTVFAGNAAAGRNDVVWDGHDARGRAVASGTYLYRLTTGEGGVSGRMSLVR